MRRERAVGTDGPHNQNEAEAHDARGLDDEAGYVRRGGADEQRGEDQWGLAVPDPEDLEAPEGGSSAHPGRTQRSSAKWLYSKPRSDDETSYPEVQPEDLNVGETLVPARCIRTTRTMSDWPSPCDGALRIIMRKSG